ncbi:MAG TPA: zinc-dependent metalloprotease [Acidobacteriota bacterium]|nr:zinc-dependent metalloprotease [Acidobacteriota bacterium]
MKLSRITAVVVVCLMLMLASAVQAPAAVGDHSYWKKKGAGATADKTSAKGKEKPFSTLIKDKVEIEGLFTFYRDTVDNSVLMSIKPEQLGPVYLCGESRTQSDGYFYDNGSMGRTFPFYFKRVGNRIMLLEKNLRIRADSTSALHRAVGSAISDHLIAVAEINSKPDKETSAVLVDAASLFVRDASNTGYFVGQRRKTGVAFDSKNSYFDLIKSFPANSEIDVKLHFKTTNPQSATTLQNNYSFFHTYHFSLSEIPESDYIPRLGDDRVGYFLSLYQDYSRLDQQSPYVRYIERWDLKKKNPGARISEPVKPIVYWVENTIPEEYRDAVAEGIEFWNPAFEKIGFRNAVVAKQMPDDADWDPADVRYSTVQWMVRPGGGYAVGPSRANPFTGEIFDADVRVSADFIRFMFNNAEMWVSPVSFDGALPEGRDLFEPENRPPADPASPWAYDYAYQSAREAAFGLSYLVGTGDLADKDSLTQEYVHAYIVELVAHEVGHTLGFRHNFKGSTIHSLEEISDREFTRRYGLTGSIMDYGPPNIKVPGYPQGEFYASVPGPYDYWLVEYGYSDFGAAAPDEELPKLQEIASRSGDPDLVYATDEDTFGRSAKSPDPLANAHDMGSSPLRFARHQVDLTRELWQNAIRKFETDGQRYQKIYSVFSTGWRSYRTAAQIVPKYVGGLYRHRSHIGDPGGKLPFVPVPASEQRAAIAFLSDYLFAPDAFDLPADLLNKLQQENLEDFSFSAYSVPQVDFPWHQTVLAVQSLALRNLYSSYVLGRLMNNQERLAEGEEKYTMYDMFTDVRQAIWQEVEQPANVNSYRRPLQLAHLSQLVGLYLSKTGAFPSDAVTLAANDLDVLERAARQAVASSSVGGMTAAHFKEVLRQIESAKKAQREFTTK